jgi:fatty acid desaturase
VNRYGWRALGRNALPYLALLGLAPLLRSGSVWAPWLLAPALGLLIYRMTIVMHDCVHHSLFTSREVNLRVGRLLGAVTAIDFTCFTRQHLRHHRNYGRPGDPQGFHYLGLERMTRAGYTWHLLRPLLGYNLRFALPESFLNPRNLRLQAVCVQLAIAALVTAGGAYPELALLPFLSAATFGLFFSQLRGIAEHGLAGSARVRSHAPNRLDRLLLYDLNFNYHAEHHRHPRHPSRDLPALAARALAPGMLRTVAGLR